MSDSQQRLLSTLLSGIPGLLALKNSDLRYEVVNPAFCQFVGKSPHDIIGKQATDLFKQDEVAQIEASDKEVLAKGRPHSAKCQLTGLDGKRWFDVQRTPILDDNDATVGLLMIAIDITEYQEMAAQGGGGASSAESEHKLQEAEAKLSELLNQLQAAQAKAAEAEKSAKAASVKLGDMEMKVAEAERKSKQLNELNDKLAAAEKAAQDAGAKLKELESSAGKTGELQAALDKKTQEADKFREDYLLVLKQLEELRNWAQQAQYQYGELQKICKVAETARDAYKGELEQLKATAAESASAKNELDAARQENTSLTAQLDEARQKCTTLEEEVTKLKQAKKEIADLLKRVSGDE